MTAAHTFKVGDKVQGGAYGDRYLLITAIGEHNFLAVDSFDGEETKWSLEYPYWQLYIPPPVKDTWTLKTVRRAPKEGDYYLGNERVFVIQATQDHTHEADVIVAITRQDGDQ